MWKLWKSAGEVRALEARMKAIELEWDDTFARLRAILGRMHKLNAKSQQNEGETTDEREEIERESLRSRRNSRFPS